MKNDTLTWEEKIDKNRELLLMHHKLQEAEDSCWARFFRFENSLLFMRFEKSYTYKGILSTPL